MRFASCIAALIFLFPIATTAAPLPQPLFITIDNNGAVAKSLEQYMPGTPVAVHVSIVHASDVAKVSLIALGPSGSPVRTQLDRNSDGTFSGNLALDEAGTWTLTVSEQSGILTTETQPISLDVTQTATDGSLPIALGAGAVVFLMAGGLGFVLLRRRSAAQVATAQARAA
jgi:hypothetical protein